MAEVGNGPLELDDRGDGAYRARVTTSQGSMWIDLSLTDVSALSDGRLKDDEATAKATIQYLLEHQEADDLPALVEIGDVIAAYSDAVDRIGALAS